VNLLTGPLQGRTYSLHGSSATSDGYFAALDAVVEAAQRRTTDTGRLIEDLGVRLPSARRARRAAYG